MSEVKSPSRKDRAARTRRDIVQAAIQEFRAGGYHGTTMVGIAKRADVAVQTVYFVFHTKAALLAAAIDAAVMGEDDPVPPKLTPWWLEGTTTDSPRAVELFVTNVATILTRSATLTASCSQPPRPTPRSATSSPTTTTYASAATQLPPRPRHQGLLKDGLDPTEAPDVLLTLVGPDVFLNLTEDRRWSIDRYTTWTIDTLCRLILWRPTGIALTTVADAADPPR